MSKSINYSKRSFEEVKNELLKFSNQYYPEIADNFNDHSVGNWFIDICAAMADSLNFAIDRMYQETQVNSSTLKSTALNNARMNGVKVPGRKPSICEVEFSCELPIAQDEGNVGLPDFLNYAPIIKRGAIVACGAYTFELQEDVDFNQQFNSQGYSNRTFTPKRNSNGIIEKYTVTKSALVYNGRTKIYKKVLASEEIKPFMEIILPDKDVMNVESVILINESDSQVNPPTNDFFKNGEEYTASNGTSKIYRYYEVDSLADQFIFGDDADINVGTNMHSCECTETDNLCCQIFKGKWNFIQQKFITEYTDNGYLKVIFGNQESRLDIPDGQTLSADYDMSNIMKESLLGVLPQVGYTMYIMYRVGGGMETNIGVNSLNTISYINICMPSNGESIKSNEVKTSLKVTNLTVGLGGKDAPSVNEIKYLTKYNINSQGRCVTLNDYKSRIMMLPPKYGSPFRVNVIEENNKILIYLLSVDNKGKLTPKINDILTENIKEYLSKYKSIGDYIELRSGKVHSIKVVVDLFVDKQYDSNTVAYNVINTIKDYMDINNHDIGENVFVGDMQKDITLIDGVYNIINMQISHMENNIEGDEIDYLSSNGILDPGYNGMWEITNPDNDIVVNIRLI